ncbi:OmpA family protein [Tabrizicola sp. J26]|uniref:OmpA family protein n=1 Tax=Alitabrizicola rongguiensis TaxID=2909234 RepID=UPI001F2D9924|nr:OmpA family protein [Tabrizicola rongguiensis]MCF1709085.1 OmpA family protein [Tabrizicola rongguiensis]
MRHHPILRTTTALTLSLSIVNGGVASAQIPGLARVLPVASADEARIWLAQSDSDCSTDPGAPGCAATETQPANEGATSPDGTAPTTDPAASAPETPPPAEEQQAESPPADATPSEAPTEAAPSAQEPAPDATEAPAEPLSAAPEPEAQPVTTVTESPAETAPQPVTNEEPAAPAPAEIQAQPVEEGSETQPATPSAQQPATEPTDPAPEVGQATDAEAPPTTDAAPADQPVAETAPLPTAEEQAVLDVLLAKPEVASAVDTLEQAIAPTGEASAPAAAAAALEGLAPPPAETSTQTISAETARSSEQDFQTKVTTAAPTSAEKKSGLSDLEKAGLVALGAVAVGMMVANNRVVANSGDRVVVDQGNGNLAVWKDDDALLRQPGVVETTQRYSDGSTLSSIARGDGSTVETVRDATGRVLRREIVFPNGQRVGIIDDTRPVKPVDVSSLPKPRVPSLSLLDDMDIAELRGQLAEAEQPGLDRYSLAQVRGIAELRALAPELSPRPITFATASSAIPPEQAGRLGQLAKLMADIIADDPRALFLVEGHTDAVGSAAYNLALSDRRAESVALALTQVFGIPPENLVVQGYGERFLKVPSAGDEPRNRRVAVRDITWLVEGSS